MTLRHGIVLRSPHASHGNRASCLPDLGPGIGGLEPGQPRPGAEHLSEDQQNQATHHNGQLCDPEDKFRNG